MKKILTLISVVLIVIYVAPSIVYSIIRLIVGPLTPVCTHLLGIVLLYFFVFFLALLLKKRYNVKYNVTEKIACKTNVVDLLLIAMASFGICLFHSFEFNIPFLQRELPQGMTIEMYNKLYNSFGMLTATVLVMPIFEELLFRGTLMNIIARYSNIKVGIIVSAFLFSIMHGWAAPFVFVPASLYGYVYYKKKHIFFPIICHVSNNLAAAIIVKMQIVKTNDLNINLIIIGLIIWVLSVTALIFRLRENGICK